METDGAIVFLLGVPGAGKTTLAFALKQAVDGVYVSSGELLQAHASDASSATRFANGDLPDPALISRLVVADLRARKGRRPAIVDGFPRAPAQYDEFVQLTRLEWEDPLFVYLTVSRDLAIHRALTRRVCTKCGRPAPALAADRCTACGHPLRRRTDDGVSQATSRIAAHAAHLDDLVTHIGAHHVVWPLDGAADVARNIEAITQLRVDRFALQRAR
jgi:adenylate kinase family enzyme